MSMNEPRSVRVAEDWGVVLQSVPSKNKKEVVKRLVEIFGLDKRDAQEILSSAPLLLVDGLSFGLAARIKTFFQKIGAVVEVTNHEVIKKNCSQVFWPQTPDLSFFVKYEAGPAEEPVQEEKAKAKSEENFLAGKKFEGFEPKPETQKKYEAPLPTEPAHGSPWNAPRPAAPLSPDVTSEPAPGFPWNAPQSAAPLSPDVAPEPERHAKGMEEMRRKFDVEKQELHAQRAEAVEKARNEFQGRLEEEKKKSGEIAKAYEDLQKKVTEREVLTSADEELRSKAATLEEKVRGLEAALKEKTSEAEHWARQKEDLTRQSEKVVAEAHQELAALRSREQEFSKKVEGLERTVQELTESLRSKESALAPSEQRIVELETALKEKISEIEPLIQQKSDLVRQSERVAAETQQELAASRSREQELSGKIEGLGRTVQELTESLRVKESALAPSEQRITELETALKEKISEIEPLIREKSDLIRQSEKVAAETQQSLVASQSREQELSWRVEGLERTVRELTQSLRSRDGMLARFEEQISELVARAFPPAHQSEPDAKFPGPVVPFPSEAAEELKKCSFCDDERSRKAGTCHFCKRALPAGSATKAKKAVELPMDLPAESVEKNRKVVESRDGDFAENAAKKQKNFEMQNDTTPGSGVESQEEERPQEKIVYVIRGNSRNLMEWHKVGNTDAEKKAFEKRHGRGLTIEEVVLKLTRGGWTVSHRDEEAITFSRLEKPFNVFMNAVGAKSLKAVNVTFPLK